MMRLPDLHALEVVATVVESGSMSVAAERLGLTQSAVSQAVKRAEAQIEVTLLHRDRRPLVPTEAGRVLATRFRELSHRIERAVEEMRATARRPERQDLKVGMVDTFASAVGPLLIRHLMDGAVALRVAAFSGLAHPLADALVRHEIDAAIISDTMGELDGLSRFPLLREPFVLICPKPWAADIGDRSLNDILLEHRLIRYSARSHAGTQVERHLRRLRIEAPQVLAFDTSESLLAMVAGGAGVAIATPLCLLQAAVHLPSLCVLPLPGAGISRELSLITRQGSLDLLAPQIADAARGMLRQHTIPQIVAQIPWLEDASASFVLTQPSGDA